MSITRGQRGAVFLFVISFTSFSDRVVALDAGCAGLIREILPLGGLSEVLKVETINEESAQALSRYTHNSPVQTQLGMNGNFGFVAVRNEAIAGFVVYERRDHFLNIVAIAVAKENRGQGVGRDLMERVISQGRTLPGIDDVRALLASDDTDSINFFSKVGLQKTEVIPQRFDRQTKSGVLFKFPIGRETGDGALPQLQLARQPLKKQSRVAVTTIPATLEFLRRIDPTLVNSGD